MDSNMHPESIAPDSAEHYTPSMKLSDELFAQIAAAPIGSPETYGATPYDRMSTLSSQREVLEGLQKYVREIPEDIPLYLASYVQDTFNARFWSRLAANDENFTTALAYQHDDELDTRMIDMINRGQVGRASPSELLLIRDQLGIRSLELACLTHPYGEKLEQLPFMQEAVRGAIENMGGQYNDAPKPRFGVKEVVHSIDGQPLGILMTRKRDFGVMDDGTVIRERSSFVLRVDSDSMLHQILTAPAIEQIVAIAKLPKQEQQEALQSFTDVIAQFLEMDEFDQAIPIATTTYAFNRDITERVLQLQAQRPPVMLDAMYMKPGVNEDEIAQRKELLSQVQEHARIHFVNSSKKDNDKFGILKGMQ